MFSTSRVARRLVVAAAATVALSASTAGAAPATYTHSQTIPVPPASNYAGQGGGDGWDISLSPTSVYNVFHHSGGVTVACHRQSDASACWSPKPVTDGVSSFSSMAQSGTYLDQATQKLYIVGRRNSDASAGVICFDTVVAEGAGDPFCGFTTLAPAGDAALASQSNFMRVGPRLYIVNPQSTAGDPGARNRVLCFEIASASACAGQPYSFGIGAGAASVNQFPAPAAALIAGRIYFPLTVDGTVSMRCFDTSTNAACGGSWPRPLPSVPIAEAVGSAFPLLAASGAPNGLCVPNGAGSPCFDLDGGTVTPPAALAAALPSTSGWNGSAVTIGPRVYYASNGNGDKITCWDFLAGAACANFPKVPTGANYLYTINADPQRPDCLWVNADGGAAQIQNFDAFSGGACGTGAIRVVSSSFIAPQAKCAPTDYLALKLVDPARSSYTSGTVTIADASGTPLAGSAPLAIDGNGAVDLTALPIDPAVGLPQFIIALTGAPAQQQAVTVELTWRADYDAECATPGTDAKPDPVAAPTPEPTPTPTPAPVATPTPTPAPQGAVLAARAEPRLTGKARFKSHSLRVGKTTTLKIGVTNSGTAASTDGEVCVRVSSSLVILKVPKGVSVKGSVVCAKRSAIEVGSTVTAANGIVVRGVSATSSATARDGKDDGVTLSGDRLRVLQAQTRGGGVTG